MADANPEPSKRSSQSQPDEQAEAVDTGGGDEAARATPSGDATPADPSVPSDVSVKEPLGPGPFSLDEFDTGVTLGTGSFGRVRIALHKTTQTPWAIKILKKAEIVRMQQVLYSFTIG